MKKYPKVVQCDARGQIVIPKDIREDLGIEEGTGFWVYSVTDEGILLKKIDAPPLEREDRIVKEITEKAGKLDIKKGNIEKSVSTYKKTKEGKLEIL